MRGARTSPRFNKTTPFGGANFPYARTRSTWPMPACRRCRRAGTRGGSRRWRCCTRRSGRWFGTLLRQTRARASELLGADPSEVALLGPTTAGLSAVAAGLDWQAGDEVLIYQDDFPVNVYPWLALETRGVTVRRLQTPALGQVTPELVLEQLTDKTRLVALASCHFVSAGALIMMPLGANCARDVLFCLDAIQTLGAFPTTVEHVDFLAADAHKWLLGPCAAGVFYVRRDLQDRLAPQALAGTTCAAPVMSRRSK